MMDCFDNGPLGYMLCGTMFIVSSVCFAILCCVMPCQIWKLKGQPEPDDELEQIGMDMPVYTINGNPIPPPPSYQMLFKDMA